MKFKKLIRNISLYFDIFKFHSLVSLSAYFSDVIVIILKRVFETVFLICLWGLISQNSSTDFKSIVAYFLITGGLSEVIMINRIPTGTEIRHKVRSGELNNYLIKPINSILAIHFGIMGNKLIMLIISIISILLGIIIKNNLNIETILFGIIFIVIAFLISLSLNTLLGIFALIIDSNAGIVSLFNHIIKIASGGLIPLSFFQSPVKEIFINSPFSYLAYIPASTLIDSSKQSMNTLLLGVVWAILLNVLFFSIWKLLLNKYEAYGI